MFLGFSFFRILPGVGFFMAGYSKLAMLVSTGFASSTYMPLQWFLNIFHAENSTVPVHLQIFFPKVLIYGFTYILPFWELLIAFSLILGLCRKCGATLGILLMIVFISGSHAALGAVGVQVVIEQALYGLIFFLIYKGVIKNYVDPLALDNILFKKK